MSDIPKSAMDAADQIAVLLWKPDGEEMPTGGNFETAKKNIALIIAGPIKEAIGYLELIRDMEKSGHPTMERLEIMKNIAVTAILALKGEDDGHT